MELTHAALILLAVTPQTHTARIYYRSSAQRLGVVADALHYLF